MKNNSEAIFNKYAKEYDQKYRDVTFYADSLDFFLKGLRQNAQVLELACGPGNLTSKLLTERSDLNILGLDISENMIELAKINNPGAEFLRMDCRFMSRIQKKFDAIIAGFLLPYLSAEDLKMLISDMSGLLNEQGWFYMSTMEAENSYLGFQSSQSAEDDKLFTNYHQKDFILQSLEKNNFEVRYTTSLSNPHYEKDLRDLILIGCKLIDHN